VFLGRLVTVLRASAAFFAGLNGMRRSKFIAANAAGGLLRRLEQRAEDAYPETPDPDRAWEPSLP
jgi:hypothetical protein